MSDNVTLNAGSSGDTLAADDISGIKYQRVKLVYGADGVNAGDVAATNPLPTSMYGITDSGELIHMPVTSEGHLEVAVHSPRLPFGAVHVENLTPEFQADPIYGINSAIMKATTYLSGTAVAANQLFSVTTGTTQYGFGTLQTRKRIRYRPGQGVVGRFTALWPANAASSILVAGFGTAESGFYFGYNGTSFGILHSTGGVREIQTLTITTASTSTQNVQVVLNDVSFTVTGMTNNGSILLTANQIAAGTFTGWDAYVSGSTIIFLANSVGNKAGAFSVAQSGAGTPVAGSFVETLAGVAATDTWIPQASWNGDTMDGAGGSGITLDPTKGNVFQINIQYLGFGAVSFMIEGAPNDNNPDFIRVHTLQIPNTRTTPSLTNPSFPFTMAAYSAGSTTDLSVKVGSVGGFIEGIKKLTGPRFTYPASTSATTDTAYRALITVRNNFTFASRANQSVVNILSINAAVKHTQPVALYLIKNATLVGTPSFSSYSSSSCTSTDTAATTCTFSDNIQVIWTGALGETGNLAFIFSDEITLQPGETLTLAAKAISGNPAWVLMSLNTREDQ